MIAPPPPLAQHQADQDRADRLAKATADAIAVKGARNAKAAKAAKAAQDRAADEARAAKLRREAEEIEEAEAAARIEADTLAAALAFSPALVQASTCPLPTSAPALAPEVIWKSQAFGAYRPATATGTIAAAVERAAPPLAAADIADWAVDCEEYSVPGLPTGSERIVSCIDRTNRWWWWWWFANDGCQTAIPYNQPAAPQLIALAAAPPIALPLVIPAAIAAEEELAAAARANEAADRLRA